MLHNARCHPLTGWLGFLSIMIGTMGPAMAQDPSNRTDRCGQYQAPPSVELETVPAATGTHEVSSPFGEIEVPIAPAAALGMYTTDVDILIWLGFPLASSQPIRGDSGYTTFPCFFPEEPLEGISTFGNYPEHNYEAILLAEPDFILNGLGYDEAVNARLPQIAPTFSVDAFDGRFWLDHFRETAEALGRTRQYEAWLEIYQSRVDEVRAEIGENPEMVVAPFGYWNGVFTSGCYVGVQCAVFRDLGLTIFEGATRNDGEGIELSHEDLGQLAGIDYVFTLMGVGEEGRTAHEGTMAEAARNPLWDRLNFVSEQNIVTYDMEMVYGSPSGQLAFLEVVAEALVD